MTPSGLIQIPPDLLQHHHAGRGPYNGPVATAAERKWAAITCVAATAVVALLFIVMR